MVGSPPRGGARGGRLSVDGACNQEPDGDTRRRNSDLNRFGPSDRRNTLRPISLVYCIDVYVNEMFFRGVPCPPYIVRGGRVTDLETNPSQLQLPYVAR